MRVAQLRVLGGAMARVPADATAFAHRSSRIMVNVAAFYEGPEDKPVREAWVDGFTAALEQGDPGAYVNFVGRRRRGARPRRLSGRDLGPAGRDQGRYDPDQPVPPQPEHPARGAERLGVAQVAAGTFDEPFRSSSRPGRGAAAAEPVPTTRAKPWSRA